jgi:hypothetical protein
MKTPEQTPLTKDECINEMGFEELNLSHKIVLVYSLGRERYLSLSNLGTPNELLLIYKEEHRLRRIVTDLIHLHNYDYDGYLTKEKLQTLISCLGKSKE